MRNTKSQVNFKLNIFSNQIRHQYNLLCGRIKELENGKESNPSGDRGLPNEEQQEEVFVLWNDIPDEIVLERPLDSKIFTFAMAIDGEKNFVVREIVDSNESFHFLFDVWHLSNERLVS